jgi:hypothetical protein
VAEMLNPFPPPTADPHLRTAKGLRRAQHVLAQRQTSGQREEADQRSGTAST